MRCSGGADDRRGDDVLHGDDLLEEGVGVVLGVFRRRHLDLGQLLARGAELVHVSLRGQGVSVGRAPHPPRRLEVGLRGVVAAGPGAHAAGTRLAGQGDQRHPTLAGRDRRRRVPHMAHVRGAARLGAVDIRAAQPHVVGHGERPEAGRVAGAEVGVDVLEPQAGVGERSGRNLGVDARQAEVG